MTPDPALRHFLRDAAAATALSSTICLIMSGPANADLAKGRLITEMDASAFLDTIGVNTHMGGPQTGPIGISYDNVEAIIRELRMIGVKHIRDTLFIGPNLSTLGLINQQLGVKVDLVHDYYGKDGGTPLMRRALANVRTRADLIEAIEGPNEPDQFGIRYNGLDGAKALVAAQSELYTAVKEDKGFAGIPVYCPSLSFPAAGGLASKLADMSAFCDFATSHDYVENRSLGPFLTLPYLQLWTSFADAFVPGRPHVITEGGWTTNPGDVEGVDEMAQAKFTLTYLLDAAALGVTRTYLYDLTDDGNDPSMTSNVNHYGLFRYNGSPKPVATMLANVNKILAGEAAGSATLSYKVLGMPENGRWFLLRRSDGSFVIALWHETYLWDREQHRPQATRSVPIKLSFETAPARVQRIDPINKATPVELRLEGNDLSLTVPDYPIFVIVRPK